MLGAPPANATLSPRTQQLLHAPLLPTLVRLATPNVVGLFAMTIVIGYDGFVLGRLGPAALAGIALVHSGQIITPISPAETHGGLLQYQTQPGHGTTFGVVLPREPKQTGERANHDRDNQS